MQWRPSALALTVAAAAGALTLSREAGVQAATEFATKSGVLTWVDPDTPADRHTYTSSRGAQWNLVMSDEFSVTNRSFRPGDDHMWTSLEKPDGVNAALELYSHNMTSTACDDDGTCYFYIKIVDEVNNLTIWNDYINPPGYQNVSFFYRAAMVQSWNKFCFQGGMVEVRTQLPGAVSSASGNPDVKKGRTARAATIKYYPTWPGIWMMGNLGRAIFSASTARMWPYSYSECNDAVFPSSNQRISACDANPGHGLNPNQGRGAPEIDILEGGGSEISTSMQVGPGMPTDFRAVVPNTTEGGCFYSNNCVTPGANSPGVPASVYTKRGHKTWYQGLRYAANNFCTVDSTLKQSYTTIKASVDKGVTVNACTLTTCPATRDVNGDLGLIDGSKNAYWGVNTNGTCFPYMNGYTGSYLCSPGNPSKLCEKTEVPESDKIAPFEYQMDALSANWPIHVAAYLDYLVYQLEWVTGNDGYIRWMLDGHPIFEIPASTITNPPQDASKTNPVKIQLEEPMYMIFNVALSSTWGAKPPNPGQACRGDGKDPDTIKICNEFPMYLKIDYIRVYQDTSAGSIMQVGCDPKSHPTKQWILDNIESYQDFDNMVTEVSGKAFCKTDDDCTIMTTNGVAVRTGSCKNKRCSCIGSSWTGPRCTSALSATSNGDSFGPPWYISVATFGTALFVTIIVLCAARRANKVDLQARKLKPGLKFATPLEREGSSTISASDGKITLAHSDSVI